MSYLAVGADLAPINCSGVDSFSMPACLKAQQAQKDAADAAALKQLADAKKRSDALNKTNAQVTKDLQTNTVTNVANIQSAAAAKVAQSAGAPTRAILIGVGVLAAAGAGYYFWKKRRKS